MRFILVLSLIALTSMSVVASEAKRHCEECNRHCEGTAKAIPKLPANDRRTIPAPQISSSTELVAPGSELKINGSGFINNYPQGHIIYLKNERQVYKLAANYSNATELIATIPESLPYGDYQLAVRLRTRYLKSRIATSLSAARLRPKAPSIIEPSYKTYKNLAELNNILSATDNNGRELIYSFESELQAGSNKLRAYYYDSGYLSLASDAIEIVLLPEQLISTKLELNGSQVLARRINNQNLELELPHKLYSDINNLNSKSTRLINQDSLIDVSPYILRANGDYSEELYLSTPSSAKYLSIKAFSSPIKISQIHVKSPESALLYNHSSKIFPLAGCSLSDNVTTRHNFFEPSSIAAGDPFLYTGDLGLNDTGGDALSLDCPCSHRSLVEASTVAQREGFAMPACTANKMRLYSFSYEALDANGFAIR